MLYAKCYMLGEYSRSTYHLRKASIISIWLRSGCRSALHSDRQFPRSLVGGSVLPDGCWQASALRVKMTCGVSAGE